MSKKFKSNTAKTYATAINAEKAAEKFIEKMPFSRARYVVTAEENGRFGVLFFNTGSEVIFFANYGFYATA